VNQPDERAVDRVGKIGIAEAAVLVQLSGYPLQERVDLFSWQFAGGGDDDGCLVVVQAEHHR
jgi:hypothetical protein